VNLQVDGRQVFAYTAAHELDPAKPTIAFVHGAGGDHSAFALQSRYFGYHGRNVLAVDLPAHGRSAGPAIPSIGAMADWLFKVVDSLKIGLLSVVGHSMGSLIALECAARQPGRVERIVLVGNAFPMKGNEAFLAAAKADDYAAFDMLTIWGHGPQVPLGANPSPGMWMYGDAQARLERLAPGVLYNDLKACNDYEDGLASAAKVRCPALFILGRRDMMTPPRNAAALAEALKARTVTVSSSGHMLMAEAPDATLDALIEFFTERETPRR
jgi:pimeloyl-ACP methyl ester carboxylesterase